MKTFNYFISPDKLTIFVDGIPRTYQNQHPDFDNLRTALYAGDEDRIQYLLDNATPIGKYDTEDGTADIEDDKIMFNGIELQHALVYRLKEMQKAGLKDPGPWLKFLTKLTQNPSQRIRDNLHTFIEDQHMALTEEGNVLAYKGVRDDFMDIYSGTVQNLPGRIIKMERAKVDDNAQNTCSNGLHVGDYDYARSWGSGGKLLLVEFSPSDAVSVPIDGQKLRVWRYKVIQEIAHDQPLSSPLYQVDPQNQIHPMSHKHPSYMNARDELDLYLQQDAWDRPDTFTVDSLMSAHHGLSRKDVGRICTELNAKLIWCEHSNDFIII